MGDSQIQLLQDREDIGDQPAVGVFGVGDAVFVGPAPEVSHLRLGPLGGVQVLGGILLRSFETGLQRTHLVLQGEAVQIDSSLGQEFFKFLLQSLRFGLFCPLFLLFGLVI